MQRGIVVTTFPQRGFCFIQDEQTGEEIFAHRLDCPASAVMPIGTRVTFEVVPFRGKTKAARIEIVSTEVRQ